MLIFKEIKILNTIKCKFCLYLITVKFKKNTRKQCLETVLPTFFFVKGFFIHYKNPSYNLSDILPVVLPIWTRLTWWYGSLVLCLSLLLLMTQLAPKNVTHRSFINKINSNFDVIYLFWQLWHTFLNVKERNGEKESYLLWEIIHIYTIMYGYFL